MQIEERFKAIEVMTGVDPHVTRTPGEAANFLAGYARAVEDAARVADSFAKDGDWDRDACVGIAASIRELQS